MAKAKHPDDVIYSLMGELRTNTAAVAAYSQQVAGLANEVKNLSTTVNDLAKIVISDGNGKDSLMTRTALIEARLDELDDQAGQGIASHQWKWLVVAGVLPGVLGFVVGLLGLIY
jgi:hypothetical protein